MQTFQPSISSDVLSALSALKLALIAAEDAGLISGDRANDFFSDALDTAGVDYDWWSEEGINQTDFARTYAGILLGKN